eukprot:gene5868-6561_t
MADRRSLEECVRQCVREELRRSSSAQGQQSNLIQRTRQLIASSATAVSRNLAEQHSTNPPRPSSSVGLNVMPITSSNLQTATSPGLKRTNVSLPGHNFRFKKRGKAASKAQVIPKSVYLLDETEQPQDQDYTVVDEMVVLKGQFDLSSDFTEDDIRAELASLFSTKLPQINQRDFDFVKRERNTISLPVVKDDHKWDFKHIKHLCGNGRLYVRLNVPKHTLVSLSDDEEMERAHHEDVQPSNVRAAKPGASAEEPKPGTSTEEPQPGTSMTASGSTCVEESSFFQDGLQSLSTIFPNTRTELLRESLIVHQDLEAAANFLSEPRSSVRHDSFVGKDDEDACQILQRLKKTMKPYICAEKVKLDKEDLLMDLFSIYKSPDFDPCLQIKLQIRGEPAVDTGGVLRQSFSDVFAQIAEGEGYLRLFRGQNARLTPVYSSEHVLTGIFEVLGKMIAHSLVQGGPGFPYLAPGIFWYIATGDLSQAVGRSSFIDVGDIELAAFLERIKDGGTNDLVEISEDESFLRFMQECGQTRKLNEKNKEEVVQCLVLHDTIIKHKAILDQFRNGLKILGFLKEVEAAPSKFVHFFIHQDDAVSANYVKQLLKLEFSEDRQIRQVQGWLFLFIENASERTLANFLCYVTGSSSCTSVFVPGSISVHIGNVDAIYASTCTLDLKIPVSFDDYLHFESSMMAVMKGKAYNTA